MPEGTGKMLCDADMLAGEEMTNGCYKVIHNAFRNKLLVDSGGYCSKCKKYVGFGSDLHIHHILPRSAGGNNNVSNLKVLCCDCHVAAHKALEREMSPPVDYTEQVCVAVHALIPIELKRKAKDLGVNLTQACIAGITAEIEKKTNE